MKKIKIFIILIVVTLIIPNNIVVASTLQLSRIELTSHIVTPFADIIEWRYKIEDGKMYKRQYNYTKDVWIGSWILIS